MLTSLHLNMKSRRVCINSRSPPASLPLKGQVTRHTTVKWPIGAIMRVTHFHFLLKHRVTPLERGSDSRGASSLEQSSFAMRHTENGEEPEDEVESKPQSGLIAGTGSGPGAAKITCDQDVGNDGGQNIRECIPKSKITVEIVECSKT